MKYIKKMIQKYKMEVFMGKKIEKKLNNKKN